MSLQKEDVYETEDLPEDDQHMVKEETHDSEEVERVHIDMEAAMKRFKGRLVNADCVDFSDSIARKRRAGYGGGAYVLEVVGPEFSEPETIQQRFQRLYYELNELTESLISEKDEPKEALNAGIEAQDVVAMIETLKSMQTAKPLSPSAESTTVSGAVQPRGQSCPSEGRFLALEARLKRIEQFVGGADEVDDLSKHAGRVPLAEAIEDLRMRVQLLHPNHVDGVHSRLTQLLAKLQMAEEKQSEKTDSELEEKVNRLYEVTSKWDDACVGLPAVVQRMHGLQKLHEQAQQFSTKLAQLAGIRTQLLKTIESEEMSLFDFRQQTSEAIAKLSADLQNLEARLNVLNL